MHGQLHNVRVSQLEALLKQQNYQLEAVKEAAIKRNSEREGEVDAAKKKASEAKAKIVAMESDTHLLEERLSEKTLEAVGN